MDCRSLELRLEALLDGGLTGAERTDCMAHLETCPQCQELLGLAATALLPMEGANLRLAEGILAQTSGPTCGPAAEQLASALDGALDPTDRMLLDLHLADCAECRALARTFELLRRDLPRLAEVRADSRLVDDVLAATLPASVRLRRWWTTAWPQWVRRPRFASEAAFAVTLALLIVLEAGGSPLQALSKRAVDATRSAAETTLQASTEAVERRAAATVDSVRRSPAARLGPRSRAFVGAAHDRTLTAAREVRAALGTFWERAASWWKSSEEAPPPPPAR